MPVLTLFDKQIRMGMGQADVHRLLSRHLAFHVHSVMDGWTFAREARQRGSRIPIVVMTAARDAAAWSGEIDASAYLSKPFSLADLLAVVARLRVPHTDSEPH